VVERMLAKNPDDRYQTPADVVRALAPFRDGVTASITTDAAPALGSTRSTAKTSRTAVLEVIPASSPTSRTRRETAPAASIDPQPQNRKGRMLLGCFLLAALGILSVTGVVVFSIWLVVDRVSTGVGKIVEEAKQHGQNWDDVEASFTPPPADAGDDRLFPKKLGNLERKSLDANAAIPEIALSRSGRRAIYGTAEQEVIVFAYHPVNQAEKEQVFQRALDAAEKQKKLGKSGMTGTSGDVKKSRVSVLFDQFPPFGSGVRLRCQLWWNHDWLFAARAKPEVNLEPLFVEYLHWLAQADAKLQQ
jgi:hypothetical protein